MASWLRSREPRICPVSRLPDPSLALFAKLAPRSFYPLLVAALNWQREVGSIVLDIADHFADRPNFQRCVGARPEQCHQLVLGRRSFSQPFRPVRFVQND